MKRILKITGVLFITAVLLCSCSKDLIKDQKFLKILIGDQVQNLCDEGRFTKANMEMRLLDPWFSEGFILDSFYIDAVSSIFIFRWPYEHFQHSNKWRFEINGKTEEDYYTSRDGYTIVLYWGEPIEELKIQYGDDYERVIDLSFLLKHAHPGTVDLELNEAIPYGEQGQYQGRLFRLLASENFAAIEYERDLEADQKINNILFQLMNQEGAVVNEGRGVSTNNRIMALFSDIAFTEEMYLVAVDQEGTEVYRRTFHPLQTT